MTKTITVIALLGRRFWIFTGQVYFYGYAAEGKPGLYFAPTIYGLQTRDRIP